MKMAQRRSSGTTICEFPVCLLLLVLIFLLPACNFVLFLSAHATTSFLCQKQAQTVAWSESRQTAIELASKPLNSGEFVFFHQAAACNSDEALLEIVVSKPGQDSILLSSAKPLPASLKPSAHGNKANVYSYKLHQRRCLMPIFNLQGLPLVGSIPMLGAPTTFEVTAQVPVEYLPSLES